jgi:hypothetical protein
MFGMVGGTHVKFCNAFEHPTIVKIMLSEGDILSVNTFLRNINNVAKRFTDFLT